MAPPPLGRTAIIMPHDLIPTPEEVRERFALHASEKQFLLDSRESIRRIMQGEDSRLLMIVGPCSLHEEESAYEYAKRFLKLSFEVKEKFFLVMRAYVEKPRTKTGWKGLLYDPDLDGSYNVKKGVLLTRKILHTLTTMQVPLACELLEITTSHYFSDLLTWGCIGARTCTSQPHRQLASTLPFTVGFKNSTDGNVENAINGIVSAAHPHVFLNPNREGRLVRTAGSGNSQCHLVLRGGEKGPNYDLASIAHAMQRCQRAGVTEKMLIDCSHDNSQKKEELQVKAFNSVFATIMSGHRHIMGMMLESHLEGGAQSLQAPLRPGVSVTDPCLNWEQTEALLLEAAACNSCQELYCSAL